MNHSLSDNYDSAANANAEDNFDEEDIGEDYFFGAENVRSEKKAYALVIYDIVNDKKRTRFAKHMSAYGTRVQKSCFETVLPLPTFQKMLSTLGRFASEEDSIRVYRVSGRSQVYQWGKDGPPEEEDVIIV